MRTPRNRPLARRAAGVLAVALVATGCATGASSASQASETPPTAAASATTKAPTTSKAPTTVPTTADGASAAGHAGSLVATDAFGVQRSPCSYGRINGLVALPDPACTPGTIDPHVTQATIGSTICVPGYTRTVRPPESVTYPEKRAAMAAYGAAGSTGAYEYDHLVSLELGGSPNVAANLFPEPYAGPYGARVKDRLENALHDLVCSGRLRLAVAQTAIATNWVRAYRTYVGPLP
jgi:hypothetical protein